MTVGTIAVLYRTVCCCQRIDWTRNHSVDEPCVSIPKVDDVGKIDRSDEGKRKAVV